MKATHFTVLAASCFLIVLGRPDRFLKQSNKELIKTEQRQEEQYSGDGSEERIRIVFKVLRPNEEPIADIKWLQKAARVTLDRGASYFNILDQNVTRRFVRAQNTQLSVIDGLISLEDDPMTAEYDAHEITNLVLGGYSL